MLLMQLKSAAALIDTHGFLWRSRWGAWGSLGDEADKPRLRAHPLGHNERRLWQEQISNR